MCKKIGLGLAIVLWGVFGSCVKAQQDNHHLIEVDARTPDQIQTVYERVTPYVYKNAIDLSGLEVNSKKQAFIHMMLPSILIAKDQLTQERKKVLALQAKKNHLSEEEQEYINILFKTYKCKQIDDLISKLQTHPTSIVLAQAAIESGWGTSRFYRDANNVFGVWSYNSSEPRIKASEERDGKAIYVKKYDALPESILSYFKTIARGPYSKFRAARKTTQELSQLLPHLKVYSELGDEYIQRLQRLIVFNKLEQYDNYMLVKKQGD